MKVEITAQVSGRMPARMRGAVRQLTGQLPTDRTFTGQREAEALGMLWYNSRFYDPVLGRFSQPDSIVPNPFLSLAFDRYQYVNSNPLKYVDPSGHWTCEDLECKEGLKYGLDNLLGILPQNLPTVKHKETINAYRTIQIQLIGKGGYDYIRKDGSLKDEVLLSIIIAVEFGVFRDNAKIYGESLEALSNQYYSTNGSTEAPCKGECTFEEQLIWLDTKQGIRDIQPSQITSSFMNYLDGARLAMKNFQYGPTDSSWEWGNAYNPSNIASWIEEGIYSGENLNYGQRYIVGAKVPGQNYYFFLVTAAQNLALTKEDKGWQLAK